MDEAHDGLRARLNAVAAARGLWTDDVGAPLGRAVRTLSDAYNAAAFPVRTDAALDAARLHFFLPRDAAKVAAALRDVALPGSMGRRGFAGPDAGSAPLRVLDVGAGLGAATLGVEQALRARSDMRPVQAVLVDNDARALGLAQALLGPAATTGVLDLSRGSSVHDGGLFDLIVLGQVLVEVGHGRPEAERVRAHAVLLRRLMAAHLRPGGLLVVVEPALRRTARRLQEVRGELLRDPRIAAGRQVHIVAPCPHDGPCPLLADADDWCHEDLSIDLPQHLVSVARAAGLRWQGLTFARLVLSDVPHDRAPLRVAAPVRREKGRHVLTFCAEGGVRRIDRLDRDARPPNAVWDALERGDGVVLADGVVPQRVGPETLVERYDGATTVTRTVSDASLTSSDTVSVTSPGSMK
jgi:SAM-dependent methyltransferase